MQWKLIRVISTFKASHHIKNRKMDGAILRGSVSEIFYYDSLLSLEIYGYLKNFVLTIRVSEYLEKKT